MKWILSFCVSLFVGCGDEGSDAGGLEVGAECTTSSDCETSSGQSCLAGFQGGYCGIAGCGASKQCPDNSGCALFENGVGYCFRTCTVSDDCNDFRSADSAAECSDSAPFLDDIADLLACVPRAIE